MVVFFLFFLFTQIRIETNGLKRLYFFLERVFVTFRFKLNTSSLSSCTFQQVSGWTRTLLHNIAHISRQQKTHDPGISCWQNNASSYSKNSSDHHQQASSYQTQDLIKTPGCRRTAGPRNVCLQIFKVKKKINFVIFRLVHRVLAANAIHLVHLINVTFTSGF